MASGANRRVRMTARSRRNEWPVARRGIQFDSEMAAPDRLKKDPNWHAEFTPNRVRMEAGRIERWRAIAGRTETRCLPLVGNKKLR
jgi:hypothetical protein